MSKGLTCYRIFIATPGGLEEERNSFKRVISEYNDSDALSRGVIFHPVGWEITLAGMGRPQAFINRDLRECDYFILVLFDRWGSSTGREPEEEYTSGTEEEYKEALDCLKSENCDIREIVVFFKAIDEQRLRDPGVQLRKVLEFKEQLEREKLLLFYTYDVITAFEDKLRRHLAQWVRDDESDLTKSPLPDSSLLIPAKNSEDIQVSGNSKARQDEISGSDELIKAAKDLAFEGHYTEAETLFAKAVIINNEPSALFSYGNFLAQRERFAQAKLKYEQAAQRADAVHQAIWKARAINRLGNLLEVQGNSTEAEAKYQESLEIFKQIENAEGVEGVAECYDNLGNLYKTEGELERAITMYQQSLGTYKQLGREEGQADIYSKLGEVYQASENFDRSQEMYQFSLRLKEKLGIKEGLADVYSNLGDMHKKQGNLEQAEEKYLQSLEIFEQLNDTRGKVDVLSSLGDIYRERKDSDQALHYYEQGLKIFEELGEKQGIADVYNNMGRVYLDCRKIDMAENMFTRSLDIFEEISEKQGMADVYNNLAEVFVLRGNAQEAEVIRQKSADLQQRDLQLYIKSLSNEVDETQQKVDELDRQATSTGQLQVLPIFIIFLLSVIFIVILCWYSGFIYYGVLISIFILLVPTIISFFTDNDWTFTKATEKAIMKEKERLYKEAKIDFTEFEFKKQKLLELKMEIGSFKR